MTVAIYDGVFGAFNLRQIVSTTYNPDVKEAGFRNSGAIYRSQSTVISGEPVIDIESMDLYGLVGSIDPSAGLAITSPGTITIPFQARTPGGMFVANGSNYTLSSTLGLLVPEEISASQDAEAGVTVKYKLYLASSDGLTQPVTINASATLASQAFVESYSMGPAKINGTALGGVKSWSYKFGITVKVDRYGGGVWPTIAGITIPEVNPEIEITFEDFAAVDDFDHFSALSTTAAVFARKNVMGGTRVADGTGGHFAATMTNGIQILQGVDGKGTENGSFTRKIMGHTQAFSRTSTI